MKKLVKKDLKSFQNAIYLDYGVLLNNEDLEDAATDLLGFFDTLVKLKKKSKVLKSSP